MCPVCLTTLALISVGAGSTGVAAVIVRKIRGEHPAKDAVRQKPADVSAIKLLPVRGASQR